jgi:ATP-dependent DNA helicase RecG
MSPDTGGQIMTEIKNIDAAEADRVIALEEGHYLDVKRIEIEPAKLSKSISAFANASGGEVFLGIAETDLFGGAKERTWAGFPDMEAANPHFQVLEGLGALGTHFTATFLACADRPGYVLHLTVPKSKGIITATDGHPYIRRNAQNFRVDTEEGLRRLKLDKGVVSFEDETLSVPAKFVTNSEAMIGFMLAVVPSAEPDEWLESQFLIDGEKPTVASALLFADEPQAALPKRSAIKIFRYKSKEDEGTRETLAFDPITIEGCLYDLIKRAVDKTKEVVESIEKLGVKGLEKVSYPEETLHEIVTNAVLHRDYSLASDIQIRIYDNRIEVESPGRLPGHVTTSNFLREQSARNPKVVRIIHKFPNPPNKDVGEGLNTAFAAMKKLKLKEPELEEQENSVIVYIAHAPLGSPEATVMEYLETHDEIANAIGRDLTGIRSENTMKEVFLRLAKRGMIERVPEKLGNRAAWRVATGGGKKPTGGETDATGEAKFATGGVSETTGEAMARDEPEPGLFDNDNTAE